MRMRGKMHELHLKTPRHATPLHVPDHPKVFLAGDGRSLVGIVVQGHGEHLILERRGIFTLLLLLVVRWMLVVRLMVRLLVRLLLPVRVWMTRGTMLR